MSRVCEIDWKIGVTGPSQQPSDWPVRRDIINARHPMVSHLLIFDSRFPGQQFGNIGPTAHLQPARFPQGPDKHHPVFLVFIDSLPLTPATHHVT